MPGYDNDFAYDRAAVGAASTPGSLEDLISTLEQRKTYLKTGRKDLEKARKRRNQS